MNDIYLQITGGSPAIVGESQDEGFKKSIELLSFDVGGGEPAVKTAADDNNEEEDGDDEKGSKPKKKSGSATARKSGDSYSFSLSIKKYLDNSSPDLFVNFCQTLIRLPTYFPTMKLTVRKSDGPTPLQFLVYEFTDAFVTSYTLSEAGGELTIPTEDIEFRCGTCKVTYRPQKLNAPPIVLGWNFDANVPL